MKTRFMKPWLLETFLLYNESVWLFLFLLFSFTIFCFYITKPSKTFHLPPSPPQLPFIGNLHQIGSKPHIAFRELSKKYGPIILLHLGKAKTVIVSSPDVVREITLTRDLEFANRTSLSTGKSLMYGTLSLFLMPYGDYWKLIQKIFVQDLSTTSKVHSHKYIREEEVASMMENISRSCSRESSVNITELIYHTTNSIAIRCGTGIKCNGTFAELGKELMGRLEDFAIGDFFPSLGWMDILSSYRWKKTFEKVDLFIENIIQEHVNNPKPDTSSNKDLLDRLLRVQQENNLERNNVKGVLMSLLLGAGSDVASTLEWIFAELFSHSRAMKKAQDEVRRVVQMKLKVQDEDLHQMDYLRCVIKETLRLHSLAPTLFRRSTCDGTKLNGYDIPPNTTIIINAWEFHRDPKMWNNPEEFIPERFSDNSIDFKGHNQFLPFGSGRRSCPAMFFGLAIVELILANLLFHFNWELPAGLKKLDMEEANNSNATKKVSIQLVPVPHCFKMV